MAGMKDTGYWLITVKFSGCSGYSTVAIDQHPAEYMAEHLENVSLILAMSITKKQYDTYEKAYSG